MTRGTFALLREHYADGVIGAGRAQANRALADIQEERIDDLLHQTRLDEDDLT